jgi:hypothetical protein
MTLAGTLVAAGVAIVALAVLLVIIIWRKGRRFAAGEVFRASRWSRGNHIFPTQVLISPTSVVHHTPQWIGTLEHSIHIAHVASVRIDTQLFFSDVFIETSGGVSPISCYGHHKADAVRMKHLIEEHQSAYFRAPAPPGERRADLLPGGDRPINKGGGA